MDSGGGPGPPRPADSPGSHLQSSHDGYVELPQSNRITRLSDLNLSQSAHYGRAVSQQLPHQSYRSSNRSVLTSQSVSANAFHVPFPENSNLGLFPFNPAVAQQASQLGGQVPSNRGSADPSAQTSTPFSNLPFIPGIPQANPSVAIPLSHPQRVNPQTNMLHQINAAASVANHSAAMQAGNLPRNVQQQSTNDFFGELEKAFAPKPRPTTSAAKGADVIDSALSMALPGPPASHQQAAPVIGAQTQPELQNARLQQQRLQQHLQLQEQLQQQLQQQQQQMRHPPASHQSLLSRQQQQMHPYLQQTQLAPGQLNAGLHTHALRSNLAGQTSLPSRHVQQQSLPSGGVGLDSHGARRDGKTRRKQQTRRPRSGSGMNIPIVPGNQMPNALAPGSLTSAHQRQQIPILPGQLAFNSRQGQFQQNPLHLQQNPASLQRALAQQPSTSGQVQGSVRPSIGAGSFPLSSTNSFMGSSTLQQQARSGHNASQGGMQNISSGLVSGAKIPQRILQGNPEMEKFDAATLQNVLRSSNDPNIKAAIQQQLEYLQYKAAMTANAQHRQTQPTQLSSSLGTNSQHLGSLPQSGDILNQNPSRASQAAILQRQKKLLQKQQLLRQQQKIQQQQMQKQQMQKQQMQQQQMQQQQIQQQHLQQQHLQQQHMQQQHMEQQQHLKQQHMQQQHLQQQQIQQQQQMQQQHQLQLRNQASLAHQQAPVSGFPSQGLPGSRQAGGVSHRARDSNTLPSRLGNQVLAQQLQHSNRRAQHSQSSHSQSASQGAPSDLAGEGQHPSSQNSQRQSSTRRPRRSSRVARNEAEAANGGSGIAVDFPVHQGRITRPRVLTGQGAEKQAQSDRLSRLDSSQIRKSGIHGLVQPPLTRSPAEAVEQAAQAAQLAAVRAASANLRTGDDKQAAEDRKRIGRETELSNIEEQKKRRLRTAPWNDYQRILAPDYTTPFSNVSDAWQRLVPYHVVLTDEDASVPQEEWDAEIDKLSKKYKDCFRSLRESFDRLFDAGFESIGSTAELPGYGSLCKDDSLILDSILLRDYYETARKQQALIAREKESRIAAEMERRRVTEMNRQRSMVQREELLAQNAMRMSAAQGRPLGSLPATHPHGPSISSGIAASGSLPPPAGPGLLPTLNRRTEGLPTASSLSGAVDSGTKNSPSIPHAPTSQYNQKQGLLPPGASPSVSTAGLHPQANFGSHGSAQYIPSISVPHGVSHASNTGLGLNTQGMMNANFRETLKDPTSSSLAVSNAQGYAQPMGMTSQSIGVSNQTKVAGTVPNPAMYHRTTSNGPLSVGQQSAGTNANASDRMLWSDGRVQQVNQSTGTGTQTVMAASGEMVRNGMQESGQSGLPVSNLHANTGHVSGSAPHAMGSISAAGMGMGGKSSERTAHVSPLNGSHHETLKPKLPGLHNTNSGLIGSENMTSFGRPLGGMASNAPPYRNVEPGITSGQRGMTPHESGTSMGFSGNMVTHGDVPNLQREAKAGPEKGNNSGVMGMDGRVGVLPNKANETGRQAKGGELGGLGMGSLLNADGS